MGYPSDDNEEMEKSVKIQNSSNDENSKTDSDEESVIPTLPNGSGVESQQETSTLVQSSEGITFQERRASLPPGLLENGQINSLCGQILRYMGDEQYSIACGRHLRGMGDQLCYNYFLRNALRRSGQFEQHQQNTNRLTESHSSPDLRKS